MLESTLERAVAGPIAAWALVSSLGLFRSPTNALQCVSLWAAAAFCGRRPWRQVPWHTAASAVVGVSMALFFAMDIDTRRLTWRVQRLLDNQRPGAAGGSIKLNQTAQLDNDTRGYAILTREAQLLIRGSQWRCTQGRAVYEVQRYAYGMGSEMHWHAAVLSQAVQDDALFVWGTHACTSTGAHCREWYLAEHGCSEAQLRGMVRRTYTEWPRLPPPAALLRMLPSSFTAAQAEFWWNAQAIAGHLMRFRPSAFPPVSLRLHGAINVHMRSGDKHEESNLPTPEACVDLAAELLLQQPLAFSRTLFLTSDSSVAIERARAHAEAQGLQVHYSSDVPRTASGFDQNLVSPDRNTTRAVLLELRRTTLFCEAWVGTRSSNWNRLIDMHRCLSAPKCRQPFVEAGDTRPGEYDTPIGSFIY
jgi:hypothetical protein